jgi:cytochrome c biogenesis protein CcmG/thiol:disulfide interchange protein DsbE
MDDDGWKSVAPFVAQHKINYPVVVGNDAVSHLYGTVDSLPTTFVIDREGKIASIHTGLVSKSSYAREIEGLLGDE